MISKLRDPHSPQSGMSMIFVVLVGFGLMVLTAVSLQMSLAHSVTRNVQEQSFLARQIADSAVAQALARLKDGGYVTPMSGGSAVAQWVNFGSGQMYYYSTHDATNGVYTIRAWGRVAENANPSNSTVAPDSVAWDGSGWMVKGSEVYVLGRRYIPQSPVYFGNGGIEKPLGGFEWAAGVDPLDPSTWVPVTSGASSYQSASVPFQASALDHPVDYLTSGVSPAPASSYPHPYTIWATQNPIGQFNVGAWFTNSAGSGVDPTINVTPAPTTTYYDTSDLSSPDHPYPVVQNLPDVQTFVHEIWSKYGSDPAAIKLWSGTYSGVHGTLASPGVTFVTGTLNVAAGTKFEGAGILVIRDDYDPNTQTDNMPSARARLEVRGEFEWTGLVIVAGWAPDVVVKNDAGASATIVGALFGEDSVQSGGEISLDSATITLRVEKPLRILYSNALFSPGGIIHSFLPLVGKEIAGIRNL